MGIILLLAILEVLKGLIQEFQVKFLDQSFLQTTYKITFMYQKDTNSFKIKFVSLKHQPGYLEACHLMLITSVILQLTIKELLEQNLVEIPLQIPSIHYSTETTKECL